MSLCLWNILAVFSFSISATSFNLLNIPELIFASAALFKSEVEERVVERDVRDVRDVTEFLRDELRPVAESHPVRNVPAF